MGVRLLKYVDLRPLNILFLETLCIFSNIVLFLIILIKFFDL